MPGSIVATWLYGSAAAGSWYYVATAFAVNMVASSIISKSLAPDGPNTNDMTQNVGSRQQQPPAGDNKVPVIYGSAYVGGIVTDLSITNDNQQMFYVLTLAEVTNTESDGTPDTYSFGNIYWGGKKCIFDGTDAYKVVGLLDESTGITDTTVSGKLNIYLFRNGSSSGVNTSQTAIEIMQYGSLMYKWDAYKLMSNVAFAIINITYNQQANLTGLQQTKFQLTNSRYRTGDCFLDYWQSKRYGAGLSLSQINTASLTELSAYSDEAFTYIPYTGGSSTQTRFRFDGTLDTNNTIMTNMQSMASCCDCLIKYNEITGQWGVIVQKPTYTVAMDINDSNMVSAIQVSPIDLASSYNIAEVKFPDSTAQDAFNSSIFDLAQINPSLLYPNEPINKQTISLPLVNNSVRAQYLANRFLEAAREDLQLKVDINFSGLQLEAGDIVTVTNASYGWTAKLFRISQVVEKFSDDGQIIVSLSLMEFNPSVYDDVNITQFTPSPNTGIGSPLGFGTLYAPTVTNIQTTAPVPSFDVAVTAASNGIVQYAEVYYSAYPTPTLSQRFFAGTTAINPGGNPYNPSDSMGVVTLSNIPQGDWYFAVKYVNALGASDFSASSVVFKWRPMTLQYTKRYLAVAYADNADGTSGFSYNPRNKAYYGLFNNDVANGGTNPANYTWYAASFGTSNYLLYANRQNRKFSFDVGNAGYLNLGGAFVPTQTSVYDSSLWSGLIDPTGSLQSFIDLDVRTGQLTIAGATGNNVNDGFLSVTNNTDGSMKVNLHDFLNFGAGVYTKSFTAATLTIDIYGRVVGFTEADNFYYTEQVFNATAGQTSFSFTHTVGWILVFRDGVLLDPSEYSETGTTVVMNTACAVNEKVVIIYMRGNSTSEYYEPLNITIASSGSNTVTYSGSPWNQVAAGDKITFANTGSPTQYTVSSVNQSTRVITFTTSISGATAGLTLYRYRAAGADYAPFTRYDQDVSAVTSFSPSTYQIRNGFEFLFINGCQLTEIDYDIDVNTSAINGFPSAMTGRFTVIQFTPNNLAVPASNIANTPAYSVASQSTYPFDSNPLAMEVYANGCLLTKGSGYDYTVSASSWVLTTAFNNNSTLLNQQTFARMGAA